MLTIESASKADLNEHCEGPSTYETYTIGECVLISSSDKSLGYKQWTLATPVPVPTGLPTLRPVVVTTPNAPVSPSTNKPVAPGSPTVMPVVVTTNKPVAPGSPTLTPVVVTTTNKPVAPGSPTLTPVTADISSSSTSKDKSDSKACFAGTETVLLESGESRPISLIAVGDRVLAADASRRLLFTEVIFVPHRANKKNAIFTHITTALGKDLKLTGSHILPAGDCDPSLPFPHVYASEVTVGNCILTVSGIEKVVSVEVTPGLGLYTVITKEQYVVVNGIIASPFAFNHFLGNSYYNIHRLVHTFYPGILRSPLLHTINEVSLLVVSCSEYVSKYELCSASFLIAIVPSCVLCAVQ